MNLNRQTPPARVVQSHLTVIRECSVQAEFVRGTSASCLPAVRIDKDPVYPIVGWRWIADVKIGANVAIIEAAGQIESGAGPILSTL
jgi:hypothetical protein